jgi:hypothetical protein
MEVLRQLDQEDLVHDLGASGDHGAQFTAVHHLRGSSAGTPDKTGDLLHRNAGARHEADEGGPELEGLPVIAKAGAFVILLNARRTLAALAESRPRN